MQATQEINISNEINVRIQELMLHYNLNVSQFSKLVGMSYSMAFNLVGGRLSKPSYDLLISIAIAFPTVGLDWLLTGRGSMLVTAENTESKVIAFEEPSPEAVPPAQEDYPDLSQATVADRLRFVMGHKKIDAKTLASKIGLYESVIDEVLANKHRKLPSTLASKLNGFWPDFNHVWFITGKGSPFFDPALLATKINPAEANSQPHKISDLAPAEAPLKAPPISVQLDLRTNAVYLPDARAAAGSGAFIESSYQEFPVSIPFLSGTGYTLIHASGDSMWPTIKDRDILIMIEVNSLRKVASGHIYTILQEAAGYVKRVFRTSAQPTVLELRSDNPTHAPVFIDTKDQVRVWEVVGIFSTNMSAFAPPAYPSTKDLVARLESLERAVFSPLNTP